MRYIVDKIPKKLEIAKKLGADYTLTPIELSKYINTFDVVFEAVGGFAIEKTLNQAILCLKGGSDNFNGCCGDVTKSKTWGSPR
jgi:threonine dehydrogenase-like Zn-dependent dehydrogenase